MLAAGMFADTAAEPLFEDGERVCFIGDSITHGDRGRGDYHEFIYLYYLTRFPDRKITIFDRGISGDTSWGTVRRFDDDIAPCKPTVSTIMLGMNDVSRGLYGSSPTCSPEVQAKRDAKLKLYREHMAKLCEKLTAAGSRLVLFTPSPFDQISRSKGAEHLIPARPRVNDGLVTMAGYCNDMAERYGAALVDMNTGMLQVLERQHAVDPTYSFYAKYRVHPNLHGHFVMAYLFLKAQNAPAVVSTVKIDAVARKVLEQANCTVADLAASERSTRFTVAAKALPFPTDEVGPLGLRLVPFMQDLNRETLCITGLRPGAYALRIDGTLVGHYDAAALVRGVNLAESRETPQYQQAAKVAAVNMQRDNRSCKLRGMALVDFKALARFKGDKTDLAQVRFFFDKQLQAMAGKSWQAFYERQFASYIESKPREAEIRAEMAALEKELYEINRPKPHTFELARIGDTLPLPAPEKIVEPEGLAFHLPFDKSLGAAKSAPACAPIEPVEVTYETGPVGHAVIIAGDAGLTYPEPDSFPLGKGSIAFWIKPHWDPKEKKGLPVVFRKNDPEQVKAGGRMRRINHVEVGLRPSKDGVHLTFFSSANPAGEDGKQRPLFATQARWSVKDWDLDEWLHVCITVGEWGRQNKTHMYIQGEVVYVWRWHAFPEAHGKTFTFAGGKRTMSLDDFRAYGRILDAAEVYELYRMGARRAEHLSREAESN